MNPEPATIRAARPDDAETILTLIRDLAAFEKLEHLAVVTPDDLRRHLFGDRPAAEVLMAEVEGKAVGMALFFPTFSTFRGQPGLYLEDIFVRPEARGRGVGKALLASVARIAVDRGCGRLEWAALDWNEPAIGFYLKLGAQAQDEWTTFRVADATLANLASLAPDRETSR